MKLTEQQRQEARVNAQRLVDSLDFPGTLEVMTDEEIRNTARALIEAEAENVRMREALRLGVPIVSGLVDEISKQGLHRPAIKKTLEIMQQALNNEGQTNGKE